MQKEKYDVDQPCKQAFIIVQVRNEGLVYIMHAPDFNQHLSYFHEILVTKTKWRLNGASTLFNYLCLMFQPFSECISYALKMLLVTDITVKPGEY